jgi:hypothetical protein
MKQFAASLVLLLTTTLSHQALAWCDNPVTGESKSFSVAMYVANGCNPNTKVPEGTEVIDFTPKGKNGEANGATQTVPFDSECKRGKDGREFSCSKNGRTPLAGTTYVTTKDKKDECDETGKGLVERLTCSKGCEGGRAPAHLEGSPWEC